MSKKKKTQVHEYVEAQDFVRINAPDCPSCEASSEKHVIRVGNKAMRDEGVYCGVCDAFITRIDDFGL